MLMVIQVSGAIKSYLAFFYTRFFFDPRLHQKYLSCRQSYRPYFLASEVEQGLHDPVFDIQLV